MTIKRKTLVAAAAVLAALSAGAALAADKLLTPKQESQAVIDDAANRLGVQPSALTKALKDAFKARIDAAVADGRLTKAQADELKRRIDAGDVPLVGAPFFHHGGFRHGGPLQLDAAASYLGMTEPQLADALHGGKTLALLAKERDKSVVGLVDAIVTAAKKRLDAAVAGGGSPTRSGTRSSATSSSGQRTS